MKHVMVSKRAKLVLKLYEFTLLSSQHFAVIRRCLPPYKVSISG